MKITARVRNATDRHDVRVATDGAAKDLAVPAKGDGRGSSVNGGEFLMLALATCYCNDIHREAARMGIPVQSVEVEASADFEGVGLAASGIRYRARVESTAGAEQIERLLKHTDAVAEVQNTVRAGVPVELVDWSG